jgi:predicted transcriptional regulator
VGSRFSLILSVEQAGSVLFIRPVSYTKTFVDFTKGIVHTPRSMTKAPAKPTDAELSILRVLWERGPSTVRQVHEVLNSKRRAGYTTVLKLLQIMTDKGLVERDDSARTHVYVARFSEEHTQRQLITHLLDRAFGGSATKLVMQALATRKASAEELMEIRRLIEEREGGGHDDR